jgi:hypothetical protein
VMAVRVGIHEENDLPITQTVESNLSPGPVPRAVTRSFSSALVSTGERLTAIEDLARSGNTAWKRRSRPCLAEPPAESPSTRYSSHCAGSLSEQSANLPGSVPDS